MKYLKVEYFYFSTLLSLAMKFKNIFISKIKFYKMFSLWSSHKL